MSHGPRFQLKGDRLKLSENDVRKACLDLLRAHRWWPIRQHVGLFHPVGRPKDIVTIGEKGDPDYVVVRAPSSFFLETKRPGGKLSDEQIARIQTLRQFYGLETVVVESVDELIAWLDRRELKPGDPLGLR
jgi:hypothetical protein